MKKEKKVNKPSDNAKRTLKGIRLRELKDQTHDDLAEFTYQLEKEFENLALENEKLRIKVIGQAKAIENLKRNKNPLSKYEGYDKNVQGIDKIKFILNRSKLQMSFKEIKQLILKLDPELKERWANIDKSLSHLLAKGCSYNAISRFKKYGEKGEYVYSILK